MLIQEVCFQNHWEKSNTDPQQYGNENFCGLVEKNSLLWTGRIGVVIKRCIKDTTNTELIKAFLQIYQFLPFPAKRSHTVGSDGDKSFIRRQWNLVQGHVLSSNDYP